MKDQNYSCYNSEFRAIHHHQVTTSIVYVYCTLAKDQCLPKPSKYSVESLSRWSIDQERVRHDQFSFLPFFCITYCFCNKGRSPGEGSESLESARVCPAVASVSERHT